jgi:hypothetical protein
MPVLPEDSAIKRAHEDQRAGKSPSTQAGEFVREEIDLIRAGAHGARSTKQAIAIGLSKARRAGVKLPAPAQGKASSQVRRKAELDLKKGRTKGRSKVSAARSQAVIQALQRERPCRSIKRRIGPSGAAKRPEAAGEGTIGCSQKGRPHEISGQGEFTGKIEIHNQRNNMKAQTTQQQNGQKQAGGDIAKVIQKRAYERYLARGQEPGHELEDWLQAERDIRQREENQASR